MGISQYNWIQLYRLVFYFKYKIIIIDYQLNSNKYGIFNFKCDFFPNKL
jgi:hypothetical protein